MSKSKQQEIGWNKNWKCFYVYLKHVEDTIVPVTRTQFFLTRNRIILFEHDRASGFRISLLQLLYAQSKKVKIEFLFLKT